MDDTVDVARLQNQLGQSLLTLGFFRESVALHEKSLATLTKANGPEHPDTNESMNNLALAYHAAGESEKALPLLEEALEVSKILRGPEHPDTLKMMSSLATTISPASMGGS